jgi:hypothetical protein
MSFFVLKAIDGDYQHGREWRSTKEVQRVDKNGYVMCRTSELARHVATNGYELIINPHLSVKHSDVPRLGSLPVTRVEAANIVGVPAMIIDTWVKNGKLTAYYMKGNGPIFARDDVLKLEAQRDKA